MKTSCSSLLSFIFILIITNVFAQNEDYKSYFKDSGEVYFQTSFQNQETAKLLSRIVSIDKIEGNSVFAFANASDFTNFLKLGLPWQILPTPTTNEDLHGMLEHVNIQDIDSWDFYPTYEAYLDIMNQFATSYPNICDTLSIGQSVDGRELLFVKISDNIGIREAEPQFLYTGTMHGDELAGYILLLRLIDYLLSNYGTDPEITELINNTEIWINPLANPDGTYKGGNHTVWSSTRYNANYVNLNRNYPDPEDGPHPDGNEWQPETLAFMQLAEENNFVMSANTHGGAEVINYPWDTWQHLSADDDWWVMVSREYADSVHQYAPSSYLDGFNNGITNGYAWYSISGGRQDYMNYFHHCRELTMELSNTKRLPESQLDDHWEWNYRSLINYIKQCNYGVSGIVSDEISGAPLRAKIFISGHDEDNSFVYADDETGFYQRLLYQGTYDITYSADGYVPKTIEGIVVSEHSETPIDVVLSNGTLTAAFSASDTIINAGGTISFIDQSLGNPVSWNWQFEGGNPSSSTQSDPSGITYTATGVFNVSLTVTNSTGDTSTLTKSSYITVSDAFLMANQTISVSEGTFYDSGGENGNYQDKEDFIMTIYPEEANSRLKIEFIYFNVEEHSSCSYDWLKIYDGSSTSSTLLGTWCGSELPETFTAQNNDGAFTFEFHSDYSVNKAGWKASVSSLSTVELSLPMGWSGLSLFMEPDNPDIENMFSGITGDLEILISESGIYWPSHELNTIGTWDPSAGYMLKMKGTSGLVVTGHPNFNKTIELSIGWNFLPVLSNEAVAIETIGNALGNSLILVKDIAGNKIYWPEMNVNTLTNLQPGKAYLICLSNAEVLTFP